MRVTYYTYRFPIVEKYEYVQVVFNQKTEDSGLTKIVADIRPDLEELVRFLHTREIISYSDVSGNSVNNLYIHSYKGQRFIEATVEFCKTQLNFKLSAWGYSFWDALSGGDTGCCDKAMKKIRRQLKEKYPSLQVLKCFVEFLEKRGLM